MDRQRRSPKFRSIPICRHCEIPKTNLGLALQNQEVFKRVMSILVKLTNLYTHQLLIIIKRAMMKNKSVMRLLIKFFPAEIPITNAYQDKESLVDIGQAKALSLDLGSAKPTTETVRAVPKKVVPDNVSLEEIDVIDISILFSGE